MARVHELARVTSRGSALFFMQVAQRGCRLTTHLCVSAMEYLHHRAGCSEIAHSMPVQRPAVCSSMRIAGTGPCGSGTLGEALEQAFVAACYRIPVVAGPSLRCRGIPHLAKSLGVCRGQFLDPVPQRPGVRLVA